ncbi:MAG: hypothetical protein FWD31_10355, partial [Planctomycetaceae bacterium]|nr:hypothetical protein [Planctomycetaceae bacterium]
MSTSKIDQRLQKIQSLYRRREFKKAYKEAVFVARQSDGPEVRDLMVASLWEWIKTQYQQNQWADAKANVHELLRLPNLPATIQAEFPPVFRGLGLNSLLPEECRQDLSSPEAQIELADLYLLKGNKTGDLLPGTLHDADRVRLAFEKIEAKQDEDALGLLQPIAFRSPLADWRLFLRGLIDHYHGHVEKADESWKRLSPNRPPARIAAQLKGMKHEKTAAASAQASGGVISGLLSVFRGKKETSATAKTELLDTLRILDGYMKQGKDKELVGRFQACKALFQTEMPLQHARLLQVIHCHIASNATLSTAKQFVDRNLPLPLDPKGNRTLAFLSERIDDDSQFRRPGGLAFPKVYWKKFAEEDVDRIESFSPQMKARVKAAVWVHLAKEIHNEFVEAWEEAYSDEEFHDMVDVPKTEKLVEDHLETALACDPTFIPAYKLLNVLFHGLPSRDQHRDKETTPLFPPRVVELYERMHRHVPDANEALLFLFEYHLNAKDMDAAKLYHDRLCTLDPLSRETLHRRKRFCTSQFREALRKRDFERAAAASRELDSGPPLESLYYRYDVVALALGYIYQVLSGDDSDIGLFFAEAERVGVEKRLPLIFAILAEGQELGLPKESLKPLKAEWDTGISGRCHGNTAGVLGDLAAMVLIVQERYPSAMKDLFRDACAFVNRSGQVKWNSEKDLFGASNLLWHIAINRRWDGYEKNYRTLAKKWLKQYPNSPLSLFFNAETHWLERGWDQPRMTNKTQKMYREFLKRAAPLKNDPLYQYYITKVEQRIKELDNSGGMFGGSYGRYDDDDDGYDNDYGDDMPTGVPIGTNVSQELRRGVKEAGGFSEEEKRMMAKTLPKEMAPFGKLMIEAI